MKTPNVIFSGVGSYIPEQVVPNSDFLSHEFYTEEGKRFDIPNEEIIRKFEKITGIKERRYARHDQVSSDLGAAAAQEALEQSGVNPEQLDYIIYAHNFGDMRYENLHIDTMPALASKVKDKLGIKNPDTVCYDILFGCPGWVQGCIQAYQMIRSGFCRHILVIGAETLSRIVDPYDRDAMIFADGAGAAVVSASYDEGRQGILGFANRTDAGEALGYLTLNPSVNPAIDRKELFIKMKGRKIYEYALNTVADGIQSALKRAGMELSDIDKLLIHQANEKMDEAILKKLSKLYKTEVDALQMMPMTIQRLGNSSVATIPTLFDLVLKGELPEHEIKPGDKLILASVGAGMHVNALIYQMPK